VPDVNTNVSWGKTSWLALIAAIGQFAVALVIYLFAPDDQKVGATAPLLTAASTLYALIEGRMKQATAKSLPSTVVLPNTPTPVVLGVDEPGDPVDGLPDIPTNPPVPVDAHLGDPLSRGEAQT
jgi:hypothetical protein